MNASPSSSALQIRLSQDEATELTQYLVQLSSFGLPLAGGLRVAAGETRNRPVSLALTALAEGIEKGKSLDQIIADSTILPGHMTGLVVAAVRSGRLAEALADLTDHQREMHELRRFIRRGFAYPLAVTAMTFLLMLVILFGITPVFERIFAEFEMQNSWLTQLLFWFRDVGIWILTGLLLFIVFAALVMRSRWGGSAFGRTIAATPLVGPLWHWLSVAEWTSLLSVLIRHGVPVSDALRLGGATITNEYMRELSLDLAAGAEQGRPLSGLISTHPAFPRALTPLIAWGESKNMLADAFEDGRHWLARRVQLRSALLQAIIPPMLFIAIGCCVMFVLGGLLMPLFTLIQSLS